MDRSWWAHNPIICILPLKYTNTRTHTHTHFNPCLNFFDFVNVSFEFHVSGAGGAMLFVIFTIFRRGAFVQIRMKHEWGTNWLEVPIKIEISAEIPECSIFTFPDHHLSLAPSESFIKVQENRLVPCQSFQLTWKSLHRLGWGTWPACAPISVCAEKACPLQPFQRASPSGFWYVSVHQSGAKTSGQVGIEQCILPSFGCTVSCLSMSGGWVNDLHEKSSLDFQHFKYTID